MADFRPPRSTLVPALLVGVLAFGAVLTGLLPLVMPFGFAAGGVLETGQVEPERWWPGIVAAPGLYGLASRKWSRWRRRWWLAALFATMTAAILLFVHQASSGQTRRPDVMSRTEKPLTVGVVTALPLFWPEGEAVGGIVNGAREGGMPPVTGHEAHAIDQVDALALRGMDALLIAQPRLFRPEELVAVDEWVRGGGRALIFADPLLVWPSDLPPGDPRRPPLTSLLDPLLAHWGLRLEPVRTGRTGIDRKMLATGHVVMLAAASRFSPVAGGEGRARCRLAERGLMALCRVGRGEARLVADADLLDDRLWLADRRRPRRPETWSADIPALVDAWLDRPLRDASGAPRRVVDEAALIAAMRAAIFAILLGTGLGWVGAIFRERQIMSQNGKDRRNRGGTEFGGEKKIR